jgi:hypothetical protein
MADATENYPKFEVCAVVTLLQAEGMSQSEVLGRLVSVYDQKVCSLKELSVRCNKFQHGGRH